ncbi:hypothetical protein HUG10_09200 [Halorarum halophilum]|uniref:Uncharacterized protein n=1 Tax=Halorarum halophilum TaxID=2743090 RepID=A0A7D5KDU5_9EURY|nr:hypothetical protein [Halobaculum halophilum]QLG27717.1 hypothetical protein HUG10_09200 [Halobaculum halophilum]
MNSIVPAPDPEAVPFNEPYTFDLEDGQRGTVTYTPEQSGAEFILAAVAISKHAGSTYELKDDDTTMFGPCAIPPTDIGDMVVCWTPARRFTESLQVIIRNVSGGPQTYHVQPVGYERAEGA